MAFRQEVIDYLHRTLSTNSNLQLVGFIGSGKSYLLRSLPYTYIDLNLIPEKSSTTLINYFTGKLSGTVVLDHFETLKNPELIPFFDWLAAHYHQNRGNLNYIFATGLPIIDYNELTFYHNLGPLITQNIYYLPPLSPSDADEFMDRCLTDMGTSLTPHQKQSFYNLTGGYMQTIKRLIEAKGDPTNIHLTYHLECLYQNLYPYLSQPHILQAAHITSSDGKFKNQILEKYINSKKPVNNFTETLTLSELKAFQYLKLHQNQICSRTDLIQAIWGITNIDVADHALDQLILRLKKKLTHFQAPYHIQTIRGRGHKLLIQ